MSEEELIRMLSNAPGYWQNETSGVLRPAVEAYLTGTAMTPEHIAAMRAYLRQWIMAPAWNQNPHADDASRAEITDLRERIDNLIDREAIDDWLRTAGDIGIDPL